jgi:hypothetical protein
MKFKNVYLALKDQGPFKRFFRNFFVTRNAWGLFHINSHVAAGSGKPKVQYGLRKSAEKAAVSMQKKNGNYYSVYKCARCDGYHIGRNRFNK